MFMLIKMIVEMRVHGTRRSGVKNDMVDILISQLMIS